LGWLSIQFAGTVADAKAEKHADEGIETSLAFGHLVVDTESGPPASRPLLDATAPAATPLRGDEDEVSRPR